MAESSPAPELVPPDADGLVGGSMIWMSETLPNSKWKFWDGSILLRVTFSLLFQRIGDRYGGDGLNTFALPNDTGRVLVGVDSADVLFDEIGDTGGTKAATMPSHDHTGSSLTVGTGNLVTGVPASTATSPGGLTVVTDVTGAAPSVSGSTGSAGGSGDNFPPYIIVRHIIKVM